MNCIKEKHTQILNTDFTHELKIKDIYPCIKCKYCFEPEDKLIWNIYYFQIGKVKQMLDLINISEYKTYFNHNLLENIIHNLYQREELQEGEIINIRNLYITDLDEDKGKKLLKIISFINEKRPNLLQDKNLLKHCCKSKKIKEMLNINENKLNENKLDEDNYIYISKDLSKLDLTYLSHPDITYFKKVYRRHTNFALPFRK